MPNPTCRPACPAPIGFGDNRRERGVQACKYVIRSTHSAWLRGPEVPRPASVRHELHRKCQSLTFDSHYHSAHSAQFAVSPHSPRSPPLSRGQPASPRCRYRLVTSLPISVTNTLRTDRTFHAKLCLVTRIARVTSDLVCRPAWRDLCVLAVRQLRRMGQLNVSYAGQRP